MMGEEDPLSVRPAAGGRYLKKNAMLTLCKNILDVTDARGRTHRFDLSDSNGPYEFRFGSWPGQADFALIEKSGHAVLLVDQKSFHLGDLTKLQEATGLNREEVGTRPPKRPDAVEIVNLPYRKIGNVVFAVGAVAFGLWSITHIEFLVLGVTLPAVIILIPLLIMARRSMLSPEDFRTEYPEVRHEADKTLAAADQWLADRRHPPVRDEDEEQVAPATNFDVQSPADTATDGL
jgi:hypothetical protein